MISQQVFTNPIHLDIKPPSRTNDVEAGSTVESVRPAKMPAATRTSGWRSHHAPRGTSATLAPGSRPNCTICRFSLKLIDTCELDARQPLPVSEP
jgi:hypothetical protein